jgi:predicted component of type VI protein secretion system
MHERVVHGNRAVAKPRAPRRCKRRERFAEADRDIFDDVMSEIPVRLHVETDARVSRERRQHVIEKRYRRRDADRGRIA